jgi:hypothetical protein
MIRWFAIAAALLMLSGCVTTEYVYRDRYYDGHLVDGRYVGDDRYYDDGSYYAAPRAGYGDYYYAPERYYSWYDYPAYSSVFWGLNRSFYDPYWYPGYYYGVTFFPRNYLGFGLSYGWPRYSSWYYSPYRYSWVDNYYDWRPWYGGRSHHRHYSPRYGSARNEAERLSRRADEGWGYGQGGARLRDNPGDTRVSEAVRRTPYGTYGTTRNPSRDADYGGAPDVRRQAYEQGLALPAGAGGGAPGYDRGYARGYPRGEAREESAARRELRVMRQSETGGYARQPRDFAEQRGGADPGYPYEAPVRGYDGGRGYDAGARSAPVFQAPPEQGFAAPEPAYREPAPRFEARESRSEDYSRSESRSESREDRGGGEVRRVGNNREE